MTALADHIEATHHAFVRTSMESLKALAEKVAAAHAENHPELKELRGLIALLDADMHDHMIREERVLFPWLRRLERPTDITSGPPWSVKRPIDCMVHDHDDVADLLRQIRGLTHDFTPPPDACGLPRPLVTPCRLRSRHPHSHPPREQHPLPRRLACRAGPTAREGQRAVTTVPWFAGHPDTLLPFYHRLPRKPDMLSQTVENALRHGPSRHPGARRHRQQ